MVEGFTINTDLNASNRSASSYSIPIIRLIYRLPPIRSDTRVRDVKKALGEEEPIGAAVVVDRDRPIGLVMSLHLDKILSRQFGVALYYDEPVSKVMDGNPLIVDGNEPLESVAHEAMCREEAKIYDHIIVTEDSRYRGIVSVKSMLDALADLQKVQTKNLSNINLLLQKEIAERKIIEASLRESEERYRSIVEYSHNGIVIIDGSFTLTYTNDEAAKIVGSPPGEIVGSDFRGFLTPESVQFVTDRYHRRRAGERFPPRYEVSVLTKTKEIRLVEISASVIEDSRGRLQTVAQLMDITERKRAEERIKASLDEKDVLLKEIHHRVKNNLQIISSLLNLQSSKIEDLYALDILTESQNRVRSMALIHEKLYQSEDLAHIDFEEYLCNLTAYLLRTYSATAGSVRLNVRAQSDVMGLDQAIPCGLIVNELVSNALKHAFPEGKTGEIQVRFHTYDRDRYILVVEDSGVGFPEDLDFRETDSLGLQLVLSLTNQLDGVIEMDRDAGTRFTIRFPVS